MAQALVGYEFLRQQLKLPLPAPHVVARVHSVSKLVPMGEQTLGVPAAMAPPGDAPMAHLLFALKHEPLNLQLALGVAERLQPQQVAQEFMARPASQYARLACWLWELANDRPLGDLGDLPAAGGAYVPVFDPAQFVTGAVTRSTRWKVDFNGLGSPRYCPTVRRTPAVQALLDADILGQAQAFAQEVGPAVLDRAVLWAYLSETENSYAIERQRPSMDKREAFMRLLRQAHDRRTVDEEYLVSLQNLAITNPLEQAMSFRTGQNWLRSGLPGAIGVSYLPPPPELCKQIMSEVMALANDDSPTVDALVRASLASFGFVFAHPFMDGNGRLSRFLFHKVACADPRLSSGLVLPVSVAMKRNEDQYLHALQSFSSSTREHWQVQMVDMSPGSQVLAKFVGSALMYRYWDATQVVEFALRMSQQALDTDLRQETEFLQRYDVARRAADQAVDMNDNDLTLLVRSMVQNGGELSRHRRKQLIARGHPLEVIEAAERAVADAMAAITADELQSAEEDAPASEKGDAPTRPRQRS